MAGSSSEKETPTVVFTENSPHSNVRGGSGIAFDFRSTMAGGGSRLVVSSSARPEKLFQSRDDDDSDDDGSSDSSSGGDDDDGSRASDSKSKSTRCDGDDVSSDDSEGARHHQVVSMIALQLRPLRCRRTRPVPADACVPGCANQDVGPVSVASLDIGTSQPKLAIVGTPPVTAQHVIAYVIRA